MFFKINHTHQTTNKNDLVSLSQHSSLVLNGKGDREYYWGGVGSLSFKYAIQGEARYKLKDRYLLSDNSNFLVLNQEQPYEIFVDNKLATETFCLFFAQPLVTDVFSNLDQPEELMLDNHSRIMPGPIFFERAHPVTREILVAIHQLQCSLESAGDVELTKELLHSFLFGLIKMEYKKESSERFCSVKKSTRDELFRRVVTARDYAHAMHGESLTLEKLAEVACLSPNHLLRSFKQYYGQSPIQYLKSLRLDKAQQFLAHSTLSIHEICDKVGYSSAGTFSNHFKASTGLTPSDYRSKKR